MIFSILLISIFEYESALSFRLKTNVHHLSEILFSVDYVRNSREIYRHSDTG